MVEHEESRAELERRAKSAKTEAGLMMFIGTALAIWALYGIVTEGNATFGVIAGAVGVLVLILGSKRYSRATDLLRR